VGREIRTKQKNGVKIWVIIVRRKKQGRLTIKFCY